MFTVLPSRGAHRAAPHPCAGTMMRNAAAMLVPLLAFAALAAPLPAQESATATSGVFRRYADQIVKIHVMEEGSSAKAGLGTGFFVSADGDIITNYHVIADHIHDPDRYRAELIDSDGTAAPLEVRAVDVVHDLAVLRTDRPQERWFRLDDPMLAQGERLYSLGHPSDLGLSIVEGTYNGHLKHTLYPKIHFTGSINPGMSGGPAISESGAVVGVNVSSAGDQLSFLVPVGRARALLATASAADYRRPDDLLREIGAQIVAYQQTYLEGMFSDSSRTVQLGSYRAVTEPASFFRCWGDAVRDREQPYEIVSHRCSTDDYLFISSEQRAGTVTVEHQLLSTAKLNTAQFYALYSSIFAQDETPYGVEEHVTKWACSTRTVRGKSGPLRSVLCVRRYVKLDGLYDAVLKVAALGGRRSGLISTLGLSGVTRESMDTATRRFMERITWQ